MTATHPSPLLARILDRLSRGDAPDSRWPSRRGEYWALCPFHADRHSGSFSVSERGYACFSCGAQGGLSALAAHLGLDTGRSAPADPLARFARQQAMRAPVPSETRETPAGTPPSAAAALPALPPGGGAGSRPAAPPARRGRVLVVDAENAPLLLQERARAWAFDRHRLFLMLPLGPRELVDLSAATCQDDLRDRCYNIQPELVVVDSLAAATSRGETSLEGARTVLTFLSALADQFEMALLVIHHLRKRPPLARAPAAQPGPEDLRGSSHLSAAARSVLTLSLSAGPSGDPDLNGPRRLEVVKTNLCPYPPPLCLTLEGGPTSVPALRYGPWVEDVPPPTYEQICAAWLLAHLAAAGGPVRPSEVVEAARLAGFPRPTLYRARQALGEQVVDVGNSRRDPNKRWVLAGSADAGQAP